MKKKLRFVNPMNKNPNTPLLTKHERAWLIYLLSYGLEGGHMSIAQKIWSNVTARRERYIIYGLNLLAEKKDYRPPLLAFSEGKWLALPLVDLLIDEGVIPMPRVSSYFPKEK